MVSEEGICALGQFNFDHFLQNKLENNEFRGNKTIFKIMAQGANDELFYAELRAVFLFSVCILDVLSFRFEAMVAKMLIFQNLKLKR